MSSSGAGSDASEGHFRSTGATSSSATNPPARNRDGGIHRPAHGDCGAARPADDGEVGCTGGGENEGGGERGLSPVGEREFRPVGEREFWPVGKQEFRPVGECRSLGDPPGAINSASLVRRSRQTGWR